MQLSTRQWVCLSIAGLIAGCVSIEQLAPPVDVTWAGQSQDMASLQRGRQIYITQCARCHVVEPVRYYSKEKWAVILPKMVLEAKLTGPEGADVREYIHAVLDRPADDS
jgi:mono/diheme cytochrome c family protein